MNRANYGGIGCVIAAHARSDHDRSGPGSPRCTGERSRLGGQLLCVLGDESFGLLAGSDKMALSSLMVQWRAMDKERCQPTAEVTLETNLYHLTPRLPSKRSKFLCGRRINKEKFKKLNSRESL